MPFVAQVYALAKGCKQELSAEDFAVHVGQHFLRTYPKVIILTHCITFCRNQIEEAFSRLGATKEFRIWRSCRGSRLCEKINITSKLKKRSSTFYLIVFFVPHVF